MKRIITVACAVMLLSGCTNPRYTRFSDAFLDVLDTVTVIIAYAQSQEHFDEAANALYAELQRLHQIFDTFNTYPGLNNLRTLNLQAGIAPVEVDPIIIELLEHSIQAYHDTSGIINIALGPVLEIWRTYRELNLEDEGHGIPEQDALLAAASLSNIEDIVIDRNNNTVFLRYEGMALDVGAIGKAFAMEHALKEFISLSSFMLHVGGDIIAGEGPRSGSRSTWGIGVRNPEAPETPLRVLDILDTSVSTSGDYHRYFMWEGQRYSHLIDPTTLMPPNKYRSVTVVHQDAVTGNILSSALFLKSLEDGKALLQQLGGEALWVLENYELVSTAGFDAISR